MLSEKEILKQDLIEIKKNEYKLDNIEGLEEKIDLCFKYLGDLDSVLRDELIYTTFYNWVVNYDYISNSLLSNMLEKLISDEYLFLNIKIKDESSVYKRTFSVLIIALIIYKHRSEKFISKEKYLDVKDALVKYYYEEKNFIGYTNDFGWAHGVAHCADALEELVGCEECTENIALEVLEAIKNVLHNKISIFSNGEDDRIANVFNTIYSKKILSSESILSWIGSLMNCLETQLGYEQYISKINSRNFLRGLYFKSMDQSFDDELITQIFKYERELR